MLLVFFSMCLPNSTNIRYIKENGSGFSRFNVCWENAEVMVVKQNERF